MCTYTSKKWYTSRTRCMSNDIRLSLANEKPGIRGQQVQRGIIHGKLFILHSVHGLSTSATWSQNAPLTDNKFITLYESLIICLRTPPTHARKNPSSCYRSPSVGDHVSEFDSQSPNISVWVTIEQNGIIWLQWNWKSHFIGGLKLINNSHSKLRADCPSWHEELRIRGSSNRRYG